jgi:hypothetical protein
MKENNFEFNPYSAEWRTDGIIYAQWLKDKADKLASDNRKGKTHEKARKAGIEASKLAQYAMLELQRAEGNPQVAFGAAWDLCSALYVAAKWEADIGKVLLQTKAARKPRPKRKTTRIWTEINSAWEDYCDDCRESNSTPNKLYFSTEWLRDNRDTYGLEYDDYAQEVTLEGTSEQLKTDTIRRRVAR